MTVEVCDGFARIASVAGWSGAGSATSHRTPDDNALIFYFIIVENEN